MQPRKGDFVELAIEKLAFGGMGLGRLDQGDERVVFVPATVPGDRVKARLWKIKKNFAEGDLVEIIRPSPKRIAARCRHFSECGGCVWQFLSYADQLQVKESQVRETLAHGAGLKDVEVKPIIAVPEPWYYRNKMEYSFAADNDSRSGKSGQCAVGLHPPKHYREVFDLQECFLPSPFDAFLVGKMREFARDYGLTAYEHRANSGLLRSLYVRSGKRTGEVMVNLVTSANFPKIKDFQELVVNSAGEFFGKNKQLPGFLAEPKLVSLYHSIMRVAKGSKTRIEERLLFGNSAYKEEMEIVVAGRAPVRLSFSVHPQAFFQPNPLQAEKLYAQVIELAGLQGHETVFDLFCGTGTIALCVAPFCERVIGVDSVVPAIENAKRNAEDNQITNVEFLAGDVDSIFSQLPEHADVIVVDPPRAGITKSALEQIIALNADKIVYVSCNPSTFARDAEILTQSGYTLKLVQPVDMLPQTAHIELVSLLEKSRV